MSTRKRKANPKYDDEAPFKRAKSTSETPTKRTPAARAVKAKRGHPDWLVTNEKSPLAYEDLHADLSDPKTYEGFTKEDWEDLRSVLPENVPLNPDGYSIACEFLKYDPDFRRGIREFQEDLSTGRLDPEWQAAAAEAMEERASGEYDAYKENKYEEFWGQKQKLSFDVLAGEATTLKLETLIENGVFKVGDEVVFSRAIGRKEKRVLIEKECKVTAVGDKTLTFAIPPGQSKYFRPNMVSQPPVHAKPDEGNIPSNGHDHVGLVVPAGVEENEASTEDNTVGGESRAAVEELDTTLENPDPGSEAALEDHNANVSNTPAHANGASNGPSTSATEPDESSLDTIHHEINNLKHLMDKAIDVDGRLNPRDLKSVPAANPWKLMRVRRNNQDLGTMFEMRDEFYAYKLPKLAKIPKK